MMTLFSSIFLFFVLYFTENSLLLHCDDFAILSLSIRLNPAEHSSNKGGNEGVS